LSAEDAAVRRRENMFNAIALAGVALELVALVVLLVMWLAFHRPYMGTQVALGIACVGLVLFLVTVVICTDWRYAREFIGRLTGAVLVVAGIPVGLGVGVVTSRWLLSLVVGVVVAVAGFATGVLSSQE